MITIKATLGEHWHIYQDGPTNTYELHLDLDTLEWFPREEFRQMKGKKVELVIKGVDEE